MGFRLGSPWECTPKKEPDSHSGAGRMLPTQLTAPAAGASTGARAGLGLIPRIQGSCLGAAAQTSICRVPSMRPTASDSAKPSASASAASHSTCWLHGCAAAHAGGAPVRETETTLQPAPVSVWQTRLPMKPLPPKTAIRGGVAAVAAQRASMVRSAGCDPGDPDPERIPSTRAERQPRHRGENKEPVLR